MQQVILGLCDRGTLLAINLLYLIVWGCAGIDKLRTGVPSWFGDKFGQSFLARFPGLTATFWLLTVSELAAFALSHCVTLSFGICQSKATPADIDARLEPPRLHSTQSWPMDHFRFQRHTADVCLFRRHPRSLNLHPICSHKHALTKPS